MTGHAAPAGTVPRVSAAPGGRATTVMEEGRLGVRTGGTTVGMTAGITGGMTVARVTARPPRLRRARDVLSHGRLPGSDLSE